MEKNEIKKLLYKQNPTAKLQYIRKSKAYYDCEVYLTVSKDSPNFINEIQTIIIKIEIPVDDMGDADFYIDMDSKYLLRWII